MITPPKRILVGGCFDIIHYGHMKFLEHARALGDELIVALEPDERIRLFKHREPVHRQAQRAEILLQLRIINDVISLPLLTTYDEYFTLVQQIMPHIIAVTAGDTQQANKQKQAAAIGAEVQVVTPYIMGFLSTDIMHRLCN